MKFRHEKHLNTNKSFFSVFAKRASYYTGVPTTFGIAVLVIVIWAVTGPIFGYSDTWQLIINTGTTIITFLMVFLIQNAQNRESTAVQLKLDELIRANKDAHNSLMDLEELECEELEAIREKFEQAASKARKTIQARGKKVSETFDIDKGE